MRAAETEKLRVIMMRAEATVGEMGLFGPLTPFFYFF
jgi:hypothetical protein